MQQQTTAEGQETWYFTFRGDATDRETGQAIGLKGAQFTGTRESTMEQAVARFGAYEIERQYSAQEFDDFKAGRADRWSPEAADGLTTWKLAHPADGSGRWMVSGEHGTVMYDLLGNHLTVWPAPGEVDAMGKRWADLAARRAGDDGAMFDLLAGYYRAQLAGGAR